MNLADSDGVVANWLVHTAGHAFRYPDHADSARVLVALDEILAAAVLGGAEQAAVDELRVWLQCKADVPRALVLAVLVGAAVPDDLLNRIIDQHLEPVPTWEQAATLDRPRRLAVGRLRSLRFGRGLPMRKDRT